MNLTKIRTGVYVCHCGTNIAPKVDVEAVTEFAQTLDGVVLARDYTYMCSEPGQALIKDDIRKHNLNRVVVASCSPLMHEPTFRRACEEGGLNPFYFQMANIREHCSWVVDDSQQATAKAKSLVSAAVHRVHYHRPGGRGWHCWYRGRAAPGRCRQAGLFGRAGGEHRWPHGPAL